MMLKTFGTIMFPALLFCACHQRSTGSRVVNNQIPVKEEDSLERNYNSILAGLRKSYILTVNNHVADREGLLKFYNKNNEEFLKDSIQYQLSVTAFYDCSKGMLEYLAKFEGDSTACDWIYTHDPYSSTIKPWQLHFTKEKWATVLIYDFLSYDPEKRNDRITTGADEIERIISRIKLPEVKYWIQNYSSGSLKEIRFKFKSYSLEPKNG